VHTLEVLRGRLVDRLDSLGRTPPQPIDLDVLLHVFEYVGFRVALGDPDDDAAIAWARATLARVAPALLGSPEGPRVATAAPDHPEPFAVPHPTGR
jgi:hypothetical protein